MNRNGFPTSFDEVPVVFDLEYASKYLVKKSFDRLKKLAIDGKFPAYKDGKFWMVKKEDFIEWIESNKPTEAKIV